MIVSTFGLEEYSKISMSPEVSHWIAAVSTTGLNFEATVALPVWTCFVLLLLPGFVTDCWPEIDFGTVLEHTGTIADQHSETGLFENVNVMIVCIAHCPA